MRLGKLIRLNRDAVGFTLVELVIVVLILGIIATVAVSKMTYSSTRAITVTLQQNLNALNDVVDMNSNGSPPSSIAPDWFVGSRIPRHPQATGSWNAIETATGVTVMHPANKVISRTTPAYWYNSSNGMIRARVGLVGSASETLTFYNDVNGSNETSLGNYSGSVSSGS